MPAARISSPTLLQDVVQVAPRFGRSVHLLHDLQAQESGAFYLTASAREALHSIASGLEAPPERAINLIGSYGAGKSALCAFLARLIQGEHDAMGVLHTHDAALRKTWSKSDARLIPVIAVGAREPLAPALFRALDAALSTCAPKAQRAWKARWKNAPDAPREISVAFGDAAREVCASGEAGGIFLIADEMGKWLEFAALQPSAGDVQVWQELAEAAARSHDAPLWVMGVLHQDASAYAQHLDRAQQNEWAKVAGRFRTVGLFPSDVERMDLIGLALQHAPEFQKQVAAHCARLSKSCAPFAPVSSGARWNDIARAAYPLHPLALLALPKLFRRAGQSHRSLFNFLSGEENGALGKFLGEQVFDDKSPAFYPLENVFDYARETLLTGHGAATRAWAEAVESVERAVLSRAEISGLALRVLKCIALLNWLRDPQLAPSPEVLDAAFEGEAWSAAARELEARKLLAWSRTRNAYRLWEGGDVDIEAEVRAAQSQQTGDVLALALRDESLFSLPRPVARRHSFETGTLRFASCVVARPNEMEAVLKEGDGLRIVLCLAENTAGSKRAQALAHKHQSVGTLIGVACESAAMSEGARDLEACGHVAHNLASQLEGDRAARRELEARCEEAETLLRREWNRAFGVVWGANTQSVIIQGASTPDENATARGARWFHRGQEISFQTAREWSRLLSQMADAAYPDAPILRNELLNRRQLSSAGASARRNLISAMIENGAHERLQISGFPPEAAIYESVLRATGLHRQNESGGWFFAAPEAERDTARLLPAWRVLEAMIFQNEAREIPLAEIFQKLQSPPLGMTNGVLPVLLCAFLRAHGGETSLYKDGAFLPEPRAADWEVLTRRPDLFAVAGCRVQGARMRVLARLAQAFGEEAAVVPIVRRLLKAARALPEHAWKTRRLPTQVLALRETMERARSPERFLFSQMPGALGFTPLDEKSSDEAIEKFFNAANHALREWSGVLPRAVEAARDEFLSACGLPPSEAGWQQLREFAARGETAVLQPVLAPLLQRLNHAGENDEGALESVLSLIAQRPPRTWSDADVDDFSARAAPLARAVREAMNAPKMNAPSASTPALQSASSARALSKREQSEARRWATEIAPSMQVRRAALENYYTLAP